MASWDEYQPPLTTKMMPAPLAPFVGVNTASVSAGPSLRPEMTSLRVKGSSADRAAAGTPRTTAASRAATQNRFIADSRAGGWCEGGGARRPHEPPRIVG